MIPADQFLLTGFGFAWWVKSKPTFDGADGELLTQLDRPCDTCKGSGWLPDRYNANSSLRCHCLDGRHKFDIEVQSHPALMEWPGGRTYRVSIVPGLVMPIITMVEACSDDPNPPRFVLIDPVVPGRAVAVGVPDAEHETVIQVPPAAGGAKWAVKLLVEST